MIYSAIYKVNILPFLWWLRNLKIDYEIVKCKGKLNMRNSIMFLYLKFLITSKTIILNI